MTAFEVRGPAVPKISRSGQFLKACGINFKKGPKFRKHSPNDLHEFRMTYFLFFFADSKYFFGVGIVTIGKIRIPKKKKKKIVFKKCLKPVRTNTALRGGNCVRFKYLNFCFIN